MKIQIKAIFRNAVKNKLVSLLNILGLSIGFTCSIFLISWVLHETSYDSFIKDKDKIYRLTSEGIISGQYIRAASCFAGVGPEALQKIPELDSYTRFIDNHAHKSLIKTDNNEYFKAGGISADSTFFNFFPFQSISGNLNTALSEKNNVVIDKPLAENLFGRDYPIGKTITIDNTEYKISAVINKVPSNSHIQFRFVIPVYRDEWWVKHQWNGDNSITYFKINTKADLISIDSMITRIIYDHNALWKNVGIKLKLQPLSDIPYSLDFKFDAAKKTSKQNIYNFSIIAFLILFIACINFTNLFISSSLNRKKTVGIKVASGASKFQIIKEYLVEISLYILFSILVSIILLELLHPVFNDLAGFTVSINLLSSRFLKIFIPLIIITTLMTGIFPGLFITKFNPVEILKGASVSKINKGHLQMILVTSQFIIASVLIISLITIEKQVRYLQNKNLGFDKENILFIHTEGNLSKSQNWDRLETNLIHDPNINSIAWRFSLPTEWNHGAALSYKPDKSDIITAEWVFIDRNYLDLMNIKFIEGDNVFKYCNDSMNYCIVNKKAINDLKIDPPYVDKVIHESGENETFVIKGVIDNINDKSLVQPVDPQIYTFPQWETDENGILLFKVNSNYKEAITSIKKYWQKEVPDRPFEYQFLDDTYNALYKSEINSGRIISIFTILSIMLTALGLLALTYFTTERRTKEIGIRKVNGASLNNILKMLNKDFMKWVILAFMIACPISFYTMNKWLENFAYKTMLSWWVFILSGVIVIFIALITISFHSWKAANKNPVEVLRYE